MLWCDIHSFLRKIDNRLYIAENATNSSNYLHELLGIYLKTDGEPKFICGISYCNNIPENDIIDSNGRLQVRGLKNILKRIHNGINK